MSTTFRMSSTTTCRTTPKPMYTASDARAAPAPRESPSRSAVAMNVPTCGRSNGSFVTRSPSSSTSIRRVRSRRQANRQTLPRAQNRFQTKPDRRVKVGPSRRVVFKRKAARRVNRGQASRSQTNPKPVGQSQARQRTLGQKLTQIEKANPYRYLGFLGIWNRRDGCDSKDALASGCLAAGAAV